MYLRLVGLHLANVGFKELTGYYFGTRIIGENFFKRIGIGGLLLAGQLNFFQRNPLKPLVKGRLPWLGLG